MKRLLAYLRSIPWLRIARWATMGFAFSTIALVVLGVLLFPAYVQHHYLSFTPNASWTVEQTQSALAEVGWPAATVAWISFATALVSAVVISFFGLFFLWRKSDDWFGLYLAFTFFTTPAAGTLVLPVLVVLPDLTPLVDVLGIMGWQLSFILFYIFPNGQFVPRWTRWMPLLWLGANLTSGLEEAAIIGSLLAVSAIGSQIYRFGWRATPLQRQQTKTVVTVLIFMAPFLALLPLVFRPPSATALGETLIWSVLARACFQLIWLLIPIAIFVAVLRYRLYDIDVIIRKTLVYTLLSALLSTVYFGMVILLQSVLDGISYADSPIAIVLSTLVIAALFAPLRRRVQALIDRRFYRRKYDAQETLTQFVVLARDEVDLDALSGAMTGVVQESMQPAHLSLWLKQ